MTIKKIIAVCLCTIGVAAPLAQADVYELRTYTTYEGRLDDLLARFENHTMRLFERHGIHNVAYWMPQDQADTLIYIVSHPDREAAAANWDAFRSDQEWLEAREASRRNGALVQEVVSVYMDATPWSPMQ
ncbi:MAG: NIPSNAP family protein [Pseudohongiellaceae bacterium]